MGTRGERHKPTDLIRGKVTGYAGAGVKQLVIAQILGISVNTLAKHYRAELETTMAQRVAQAASHFYALAFNEKTPAVVREKALEFILTRQGGWVETVRTEHSGRDGADFPTQNGPGVVIYNANGPALPATGPQPHIRLPDNGRGRPEPLPLAPPIIDGTFEEVEAQ